MYIKLRYGDGKEHVINPNCSGINLLVFIADLCGWEGDDDQSTLDVCDSKGQPRNLSSIQNGNALGALSTHETYVPMTVKIVSVKNTPGPEYTVLLSRDDDLYPSIRASLDTIEASFRKTKNRSIIDHKGASHSRLASSKKHTSAKNK